MHVFERFLITLFIWIKTVTCQILAVERSMYHFYLIYIYLKQRINDMRLNIGSDVLISTFLYAHAR